MRQPGLRWVRAAAVSAGVATGDDVGIGVDGGRGVIVGLGV